MQQPEKVWGDALAEQARQVLDSHLAEANARQLLESHLAGVKAKEQLESLMKLISMQSSSSQEQAGAKARMPEDLQSQSTGYPSTSQGSGQGSRQGSSGHGSGSGGSGHGSGSGSRGQDSGSGSGKGSGSGDGSTGSDGYCGDGSTGSDESDNSSQGDETAHVHRKQYLPPGLVEPWAATTLPTPLGLPMKVEVNSMKTEDHLAGALAHWESCLQSAVAGAPPGVPPGLAALQLPELQKPRAPQGPQPGGTPLTGLLQNVLLQVANTFSPEDAVAVCNALAKSLAAVLMRNVNAPPVPQNQVQDIQAMRLLQQVLERQQALHSSELVTAAMLETAQNVATNAAQQAAAAWQQHNASQNQMLAWQQESIASQQQMLFQRAMESSMTGMPVPSACDPRMPAIFTAAPPTQDVRREGFAGNAPVPAHVLGDGSLALPPHLLSSAAPQHFSGGHGAAYPSYNCLPAGVPSAPGFTPLPKVSRNNGGSGKGTHQNKAPSHTNSVGHSKGGKAGNMGRGGKNPATKVASKESSRHSQAIDTQNGFEASLRTHLETLREMDCNRILLTRKINRLGFQSAQVLETYFAQYGTVSHVLVSHCYAKSRNLRFRPSGLGFVVMSTAEEAQAILADGPELYISKDLAGSKDNVAIYVMPFKRQLDLDFQEFEDCE